MQVVLLGTGTPNAEHDRSGPSVAVVAAGGKPCIIDCGPGVVRQASGAFQKGTTELEPRKLENLFLTHLHSDHTAGLPDIILSPWVLERKAPLKVWGPQGTEHMVNCIIEAYSSDINERLNGLEPANAPGIQVEVTETSPGMAIETDHMRVDCFRVNHGGLESVGYRFTSGGKSVVISGDTAPFDGIEKCYADCDILVHEVYSERGLKNRSRDWQKYHSTVHTSSKELAELADRVKPGLLVLYHQLLHGESEEGLMKEIRNIYSGDVVYGRDLDTF